MRLGAREIGGSLSEELQRVWESRLRKVEFLAQWPGSKKRSPARRSNFNLRSRRRGLGSAFSWKSSERVACLAARSLGRELVTLSQRPPMTRDRIAGGPRPISCRSRCLAFDQIRGSGVSPDVSAELGELPWLAIPSINDQPAS